MYTPYVKLNKNFVNVKVLYRFPTFSRKYNSKVVIMLQEDRTSPMIRYIVAEYFITGFSFKIVRLSCEEFINKDRKSI